MSSALVKTQLDKTLRVKSLADLVRVRTAEQVWLLVDVSGSMADLMRNGKTRITGLREVVADISKGRTVKMIAFGNDGAFVTQSVPNACGGTPLHDAIDLAKRTEVGRAIVISDGVPDNQPMALEAARNFGGQIDVVFVGDPGEHGESFLKQLAEATGGTEFHGDLSEPKQLTKAILGLITAGTDEEE